MEKINLVKRAVLFLRAVGLLFMLYPAIIQGFYSLIDFHYEYTLDTIATMIINSAYSMLTGLVFYEIAHILPIITKNEKDAS